MAHLNVILDKKKEDTLSGEVETRSLKGTYNVKVGNRVFIAKSAISSIIAPGMRVIITKTASGWSVIGLEGTTKRNLKEILING